MSRHRGTEIRKLPQKLREFTKHAIDHMNENGEFDRPLLWYYSPMDSAWSLGHFENRGIVSRFDKSMNSPNSPHHQGIGR